MEIITQREREELNKINSKLNSIMRKNCIKEIRFNPNDKFKLIFEMVNL